MPPKKPAAKKAPARKPAAKKAAKPTVKKAAAKKPVAKKAAPKKPAAKKTTAKKPVVKKTTPKKPTAKKPAAKKTVAKKPAVKKPAAKKAAAKKPVAKKAAPKKPTVKTAPAPKKEARKKPQPKAKEVVVKKVTEKIETVSAPAPAPAVAPAPAAAKPAAASSTESAPLARSATIDMSDKKSEVVFSFDTTGSMYPCLTQVRRNIQDCVKRLFTDIGPSNLRIGITAHGDYCDASWSYVTKHLPLSNNEKDIIQFVETVGPTGGGDAPECYELVLHEAQGFSWTPGWNKVLVLIGDELPHEKGQNPKGLNWREECDKLKALGVQVHGVQALSRRHATKFYSEISERTGGVHMPLDQFSAISDLVTAVCYREARPSVLEDFEKEIQAGGRYNRSLQTAFDKMLGRERKSGEAPGDMNAVLPGRFQVLKVDNDCSIKDFVESQGITFKAGRGFYEFNKPEIIQDQKEIVLMDPKTGDMFEGDYARTLINAPKGAGKRRIAPGEIDFVPFIQSTSYNRKLIGGTRFLYEVTEGY